jgi:D-alanine transaminase
MVAFAAEHIAIGRLSLTSAALASPPSRPLASKRLHHPDFVVLAFLNGHFVSRAAAAISVEDRGFVFGDGVYEVWRVVDGRLFESARHLDRLRFGLRELRIAEPEIVQPDVLDGIAARLLAESGLAAGEATLYVEITRGAAPRTHQFPPAATAPTVYATVNGFTPPDAIRAQGAACITVPDIRWARCDIKTIQLLPNVLAKQAAAERGAIDAIMVRDGIVTESSHANVVAVIDGAVRTHPTNHRILAGVTRAVVIEIARGLGYDVREEAFAESDMARADELFLVGTTTDVMPVVGVNDAAIGSGRPGPIAQRLHAELRGRLGALAAATRADSRAAATA